MLKKIVLAAVAAALLVLILPSVVNGYGAAHVGYTHVGPNGVYHTGRTAAYGPGGAYAGGHTGAYGAGGAAGGYHYAAGSYGGAAAGGYHYNYVR